MDPDALLRWIVRDINEGRLGEAMLGLAQLREWRWRGGFAPTVKLAVVPDPACVCTVGAQPCPVHPGNTRTKEEKIAFRKEWDAQVESGS